MTSLRSIKQIVEVSFAVSSAEILSEKGSLTPAAALVKDGQLIGMSMLHYSDDAEKYAVFAALVDVAIDKGADTLITVVEVWTGRATEAEMAAGARAVDDPQRGEALVIAISMRGGRESSWYRPFTRADDGTILWLSAGKWVDDMQMNLLPDKWKSP